MRSRPHGRALLGASGLALSALIIAGCAGGATTDGGSTDDSGSDHPGTLTFVRPAASNGWEGDKCIDTSIILNPAVYDTLLRIEVPSGDGLAPGLAESYEWDDEATAYVFHLRENAAFSDGEPVTAEDVAFSVNEWITGEFSSSYYANVDHAEVIDERTVQIVMRQIDTFLPSLLTWCTSPIYPADFGGVSREEFFENPVGAGPYAVEAWEDPMGTAERITFVPNEFYYGWDGGEPPLDSIIVETVTDPNQRALSFQAGDIDLLEAVDSATALQMDPEQIMTTQPNPIRSILVNMEVPGLDNPQVRQAMSMAIDRETLATTLDDGSVAATGALPVNVPGSLEPTVPLTYDPEAATTMLAEAGASDLSFSLLYDAADNSTDVMAQTVQAQLAAIGITVTLENTDGNTLSARQGDGDYELSFAGASAISPTIFDPISWIAIQYGWTGSASSVIQDEFLAGTSTLDEAEQEKHALAVQDFITTDNGMIGLVNGAAIYAAQPWVSGFTPLQYQSFYFDTLGD